MCSAAAELPLPDKVEFNRDVRPILSENCFKCHGFDKNTREGDRRLDTREGAFAENDGVRGIVPGKLADSELHLRVHSKDRDEQMPPPKSGKKLSARDVAILDRWIEQGAEYQAHWAYAAVRKPELKLGAGEHPIDSLVRPRLQQQGLTPAPEADRRTLIRRVSFDLTGLPPNAEQVESFVNDPAPDAYAKLVDRLLAQPEYGERMAVYWLDVVRYADSIGFHSDNPRNVWPYRDYVIRAFNENKPFDRFTIEQLAGDLLPGATVAQKVASGFNRLNLTTEEGGAQAKDYEARTVADRVRAIGTTWLAQTTGCAQCHDHKYDPITAKDFYQLGAFFADLKESAIGRREDGLLVATAEEDAKLKEFDARIAEAKQRLEKATPEITAAQADWETQHAPAGGSAVEWTPLHPETLASTANATFTVEAGEIIRAVTPPGTETDAFVIGIPSGTQEITGFRLEALKSSQLPRLGPGRSANGNFVLSELSVSMRDAAGAEQPLKLAAAFASFEQTGFPAAETIDGIVGKKDNGWAVLEQVGRDHTIDFALVEPLHVTAGSTFLFKLRHDWGGNHVLGKFRLSATASVQPVRPAQAALPANVAAALKVPNGERTDAQRAEISKHFRATTPLLAEARAALAAAEKERREFDEKLPKSLVSESMTQPRTVRLLARGDWQDESGEVVQPGVPGFLPQPSVEGRRLTRLDLAEWLVASENPLTARVFVNRVWKLFFGTGLSKVLDDFGAQGEAPLHAELLDWLASEFIQPSTAAAQAWDVKHLVRLIVTSQTYRQSSQASPELQQRDPFNRELARQSRFRLDAEFVRDNALAVSGLLVRKTGGPSVKPYQPAGYWENLNFPTREWAADADANQWRRGLYTWWQRSYLHPSLLAFDAPSREECTAERVRSNIPQQALVLLNDPTYVEAARALAARIVREGKGSTAERVTGAFGQVLGRPPREDELRTALGLFGKHLNVYVGDPEAAVQLIKTGVAPVPADVFAPELAAWTNVARLILNLHETITRF
jgi:hypothetical protein